MNAVWIGLAAGATALAAILLSYHHIRVSRDAIRRITRLENAPRVDDLDFTARNGDLIRLADLRGEATLLVTLPSRGADPIRMGRLGALRRRFGPAKLEIVGVPVGVTDSPDDQTARTAGAIPVLAVHEAHPLNERAREDFGDIEQPYTKLVVDAEGRVTARFDRSADGMDAELNRAVEQALRN